MSTAEPARILGGAVGARRQDSSVVEVAREQPVFDYRDISGTHRAPGSGPPVTIAYLTADLSRNTARDLEEAEH